MANKTVSDIYGYATDLLKIDSDTTVIPGLQESRTLNWIDDLHTQFFQTFYDNGQVLPDYMKSETGFDLVSSTDLDGAITTASTEVDLTDADDMDSSGGIVIKEEFQYDVVWFTGKSSNQLTGVTGIDYAHADAEMVYKLYALPSNFWRVRPGKGRGDGVMIDGASYKEVPELPQAGEFSIVNDGSNNMYLWLLDSSGDCLVVYDKMPTTLDATGDTIDIPSPHHWYLVHGLMAIFKQIQDTDYIPNKEEIQMARVFKSASTKRSAGKKISAGNAYFRGSGRISLRNLMRSI